MRDLTLTVDYRAGVVQLGLVQNAVRGKPAPPTLPLVAESGPR
jgi:hypothetical protein